MAREVFRGAVPDGLLYDTRHDMWVRVDGDDVVIGATSLGIFHAGEIIAFTAKPRGAEVDNGRGLGTVECAKTVLAVHAPVSFVLTQANEDAEEKPALINRDPYGRGWMVRGHARDWERERTALVDGATYRHHVLAMEPDAEIT
ncbi:glycine cleavage system protein H [Sulfurisoma sediminicola]|uniref:Glycine cleavage system H protein n=1 Tax=Sulfurisoma sediminicola TaxID=1381557 RepID=A0A497XFE9_9PROT|nr:glycine cleavage system protein H [Sulfurisoma sediminicola]RLJ65389.1 glycine cleavage system H protein [Sulfurisoma sediminicola]